ncbi:MAG: glycosyltransferase family 2 protein [Myxococcales bacterium]|nr:glycosyltransferase family 2 protein [Myxococcales bacterium]
MYRGATVGVVVPAYNEEKLITSTLHSIPAWIDRIVVVDDASSDQTAAAVGAFEDPRVELVRHVRNRGVGAAIVNGYRRSLELGLELTVVMAGDGQMDPADLPQLLDPLVDGDADYVKGNRLTDPRLFQRMPLWRIVGNFALSCLTRPVSGYWHVVDSQCGYTAIHQGALSRLPLDALYPRYGFPNDVLAKLRVIDARVADRDVSPVYGSESSGIYWLTAIFALSFVLLRSLSSRLVSQYVEPALAEWGLVGAKRPPRLRLVPGARLVSDDERRAVGNR